MANFLGEIMVGPNKGEFFLYLSSEVSAIGQMICHNGTEPPACRVRRRERRPAVAVTAEPRLRFTHGEFRGEPRSLLSVEVVPQLRANLRLRPRHDESAGPTSAVEKLPPGARVAGQPEAETTGRLGRRREDVSRDAAHEVARELEETCRASRGAAWRGGVLGRWWAPWRAPVTVGEEQERSGTLPNARGSGLPHHRACACCAHRTRRVSSGTSLRADRVSLVARAVAGRELKAKP
mmetsp:Transcript_32748/g.98559  ORF Transcript_32748/g.98559 Transcript_32748/m.98559 type:complete len:236 (+) Transcript_32748:734-1441(+)